MKIYGLALLFVCFATNCFAQQSTVVDYGGYLGVSGTPADNTIIATEESGQFVLRITDQTINGPVTQEHTWNLAYVKRLTVNALEGNNIIENNTSKPSWLIVTGFGTNRLVGGSSQDILSGSNGNDHMEGNAGNDMLGLSYGQDYGDGGPGSDYILAEPHDVVISDSSDRVIIRTLPQPPPQPPTTTPAPLPSPLSLQVVSGTSVDNKIKFKTLHNAQEYSFVRPASPDRTQFITIKNTSNRDASITTRIVNANGVSISPQNAVNIQSGQIQKYELTYAPTNVGEFHTGSKLEFLSDDLVRLSINLEGYSTFNSDITYDGKVDLLDIQLVLQQINNTVPYHLAIDVNGDGQSNEDDILVIQQEYRLSR